MAAAGEGASAGGELSTGTGYVEGNASIMWRCLDLLSRLGLLRRNNVRLRYSGRGSFRFAAE